MRAGEAVAAPATPGRRRLVAEFLTLFVAAPLMMAAAMPPGWMWPALGTLSAAGFVLLALTPGFRLRRLFDRALYVDWRALALFVAVAATVSVVLVLSLRPEMTLWLPRNQPLLWLLILLAYPFVSVLPQEIVYRSLFFTRYGGLFPDRRTAILANAACFSLAHLFYLNWVAVGLAAVGGLVFAWAYASRGSFGFACLMHALAGQIIFTSGLGVYFYHGAIPG